MNDSLARLYAVEWSALAGRLHIQPLRETLRLGAISYLEDRKSDYILVAIGRTHEEATKLLMQLEDNKTAPEKDDTTDLSGP